MGQSMIIKVKITCSKVLTFHVYNCSRKISDVCFNCCQWKRCLKFFGRSCTFKLCKVCVSGLKICLLYHSLQVGWMVLRSVWKYCKWWSSKVNVASSQRWIVTPRRQYFDKCFRNKENAGSWKPVRMSFVRIRRLLLASQEPVVK